MAINRQTLHQYLAYLKKEGVSPATLKRKEAALKKFQSWREKEYGPKYPLPKGAPKPKKIISKGILPRAFPPFLRYFSFLIGLVLLAGLGWGVYSQFFAQPKESPSMALPTNPPLLISFQGQLTDDDGTPINATIPAIFRLYNVDEGGTALWEEQKNVSTDQDGIFNTFLGDTTTLDPAIFRDNMNLWLAIEIDSDGEMEPRQQIATVGYAFNSRYLQGYEATTAATANTIPVINAAGDLVLASSSPTVEATSGTFGLKGEAITIQSTGGTGGGDILIQPDADTQGQVIIYSATTADNSFTVQNSNITTGSLIYGEAGTSATGYNLLKLASGSPLTDKFVVDYAGNTDITGNLTVNSSGFFAGNVGVGTTSPSAPLSVGSSSQFQVDNSGDIVKLKNLTYSWPSAHTINGFLKDDGSGNLSWSTDITATSMKWNALTNPDGNLSLSHQAYTTTFTWGAATGTNNLFTLTDTANNTGTGYLLNLNTASGSTLKPLRVASAGVEALAIDATGNVGIGTTSPGAKLDVNGTGRFATSVSSPLFQGDAGAVTFGNDSYATTIAGSGLTISPTAWTATPTISGLITATSGLTANGALTANSVFTLGDGADAGSVNTSSWDISTTGVASGFTGLTSSGTITFSSLTANRLVTTTTGGQLTTSDAGTAGQPLLSGGTSSPNWGTLGLVYGGTNADLSGVAQGGLIYKETSALAGTGALTGILQGNNASAPTAITGTANYLPKWSSTAPYLTTASQIFDSGANVGIGNSNPQALLHVGAGGTPNYASSGDVYIQNDLEVDGTIYGALDITDATFDFLEVKRAATFSAQIASDIPITVKNTGGNEVARFTNEGKLRLGSAGAPTDTLDIDGDADISGNLDVGNGLDVLGANFTVGGANFTVSQAGTVTGGTYNGQTISSTASFTGTLSVASTFNANGNVGLGNEATDTINAAGQFVSGLIPQTNSYNLGSPTNHWGALYVDSIYGGQVGEFDFLKARGATLSAEIPTDKTLVLEGLASGHTANLIEANANGATALTLSPAGNLTLGGTITLPNGNTLTGVASYIQFNNGISVGGGTTYRFTSAGDAYLNNLYTGGTQRLSSTGALANITDYSQSSGNFAISGTGTFSTATGNISLNGATTVADGKSFTANGPVTLGDGGDAVAINSNIWDITSAGVASGLTQLTVDNLQLDGNTLSSTTDNITLDAAAYLVIADQIASSLIPSATNTYDLGSPENYWDDAYINTLTANSLNFDFIAARGATFSAEVATDKTLVLNAATGQTANLLEINSAPGASGDLMVVTGGGNVSIGNSNPGTYKLDVAGTGRFNSTANPGLTVGDGAIGYLKIGGSTIYDNNSDLTLDSDTSLVILADDLQINGNDIYDSGANQRINLGATTTLYNTTTNLSGTTALTASSLATFTTASSLAMPATTSLALGGSATIYGGTAASGTLTLQSTSSATKGNVLINPSGGNVGIGTTTPGATLDVNGNLRIGTLTAGATNTVLIHSGNIVQQRTIDSRVWGSALVDYSGTTANYIPKMLDADTITNSIIYEAANGRIGISTTSPGSKLTVAGGASYFDALPAPTGVTANPTSGGGLVAGTYYYVVNAFDSNGLSSNKSSQVSCTVDGSTTTACQISWVAVPGAVNYRVFGRSSNSQNQYWQTTSTYYTDTGAAGTSGTPPSPISAFFTGNIKAERFADSANDTYYLDPAYATLSLTTAGAAGIGYSAGQMSGATAKLAVDGNVGIGTTTPGQKLEVYGGNILVNGAGLTDPIIQFRDGTAVQWSLGMDDQSLGSGNPFIFSNGDGLGSPIMTLKSGNVGIGTTAPNTELSLNHGYINFEPSLTSWLKTGGEGILMWNSNDIEWLESTYESGYGHRLYSIDPGAGGVTHLRLAARNNSASWTDMVTFVSNGNVGIGTTAPVAKLDIQDSADVTARVVRTGSGGIASLAAVSNSKSIQVRHLDTLADIRVGGAANVDLAFRFSGDTERMRITSGGNVGIGTTAPDAALHAYRSAGSAVIKAQTTSNTHGANLSLMANVDGGGPELALFSLAPGYSAGSYFGLSWPDAMFMVAHYGTGLGIGTYTGGGPLILGTNNIERMRITQDGNVGIGTTSPGAKLDVNGEIKVGDGTGQIYGKSYYLGFSDNRAIAPSEYAHHAMSFGFTAFNNNNTSPWADFIILNSYGDPSGGNDNLLTFSRSGIHAKMWQQGWNSSTAFSSNRNFAFASGTSNYVPKFNDYDSFTNSLIYDNGTNVGIGTTGPGAKLHIYTSAAYPQALIQSTSDHGVLEVKSPKSKVVNLTLSNNNNTNNWAISMRNEYDSPTYRLGFYNAGEKFYIGTDGTIAVFRDVYMRGGGSITNASYINTQQADQHLWIRQYNGTNRFAFRTTDGYGHGKAWVSGWGDLAENIQPKEGVTLEPGDVVKPDSNSRNTVTKSSSAYDSQIVGIISTKPGLLMNQDVEDKDNRGVPVALAGRVPTKVSTINGNIRNGDPLTSSPLPGIAMKATKAGKIIGYAMEDYPYTQSQGDPALDAMDEISYHEEYFVGTYPVGKISVIISPSWYDPDVYLTQTGDIAINDADGNPKNLLADETIETQIANLKSQNYNLKLKTGETVERIANFAETATARLKAGLIETTNLIAENLIAKKINSEEVISPLIETEEIKFSENARLRQGSGGQAKVAIVNSQDEPTAEFNTETKETTLFGDLEVNGNVGIGQEVSAPKASFGDLLAQKINTDEIQANTIHADTAQISADATISGTLYVDRVVARQGGFGELLAENISMDSIKSIVKEEVGILNSTQGGQASQDDGGGSQDDDVLSRHSDESQNLDSGEPSQEEFDLQALLAKVEEWAGTSAKNDLTLECTTGAENQILNQVQDDGSVVSQNDEGGVVQDDGTSHSGLDPESKNLCLVDTNLTVLGGRTSLSDTAIAGQLSVGNLVINNNSLDVLGDTLYIQKLAMGGLDILNGKLTVDIDGNVFIAAHLTVGGGLATNEIRPMEGGDLTFNLANVIPDPIRDQGETDPDFRQDDGGGAVQDDENKTGLDNTGFGKLLVKGINNETVASIDASGSAKFKEIATDLLRINADNEATQSAVLIASAENFENIGILAPGLQTNATAGEAVLPAGEKELVIYNDKLTDQSLVYLTPTADTENKILYVKEKKILNQVQDDGTGAVQDDGTGAVQDDGDVGQDNSKKTGYFVVGLNEGLGWDVRFNWWIIN